MELYSYEILDRTHVIMENIESHIIENDGCTKEMKELAVKAQRALLDLYQLAGKVSNAAFSETVSVPHETTEPNEQEGLRNQIMIEDKIREQFEEKLLANIRTIMEKYGYQSRNMADEIVEVAWQAALSAKSVPEQMGSPIQKLMEYLTNILDEDEFNQCDSILAEQGISAPQPTDERVRELEKDAARYRWLCENKLVNWPQIVGFYFNADTGIDDAIDQAMKEANK